MTKSHLSYLSHFKTQTSSLCETKYAVLLFSNISFHSRNTQVFKICKLPKWGCHTLKAILTTLSISFWYLLIVLCLHDSSSLWILYVSLSLWPFLTFFELKVTNILKSSGWGLEKSELSWKQNSHRCVSCRTIHPCHTAAILDLTYVLQAWSRGDACLIWGLQL